MNPHTGFLGGAYFASILLSDGPALGSWLHRHRACRNRGASATGARGNDRVPEGDPHLRRDRRNPCKPAFEYPLGDGRTSRRGARRSRRAGAGGSGPASARCRATGLGRTGGERSGRANRRATHAGGARARANREARSHWRSSRTAARRRQGCGPPCFRLP